MPETKTPTPPALSPEHRPARLQRSASSRLYAILDLDCLASAGIEPLAAAERLVAERPWALQLRAKHATPRESLELLRALLPICRKENVPLYANDRPDIALLAGVDGVHLGQEDLPLAELRELMRLVQQGSRADGSSSRSFQAELLVGISTHNLPQLEQALERPPDYVAFGPVFATQSKLNPDPEVGLTTLVAAHARAAACGVPLVAIGGITRERASSINSHADIVAVISDLFGGGESGISQRVQAFHAALPARFSESAASPRSSSPR